MAEDKEKIWYKKWWGILLAFLLLPFFVIWYAWAKSKWSKNWKIAATLAALIFIGVAAAVSPDQESQTSQTESSNQPVVNQQDSSEEDIDNEPVAELPEYTFIQTVDITYLRREYHYAWHREKPSRQQVVDLILALREESCPSEKICDFMLWDSDEAFENRNDTDNSSDKYSANNKKHLIGYHNSGGLFYYYGGGEVYLDDENGSETDLTD